MQGFRTIISLQREQISLKYCPRCSAAICRRTKSSLKAPNTTQNVRGATTKAPKLRIPPRPGFCINVEKSSYTKAQSSSRTKRRSSSSLTGQSSSASSTRMLTRSSAQSLANSPEQVSRQLSSRSSLLQRSPTPKRSCKSGADSDISRRSVFHTYIRNLL
jgi:hypothetical protein